MSNLSVALTSARTYLNDDAASLWSDAALIPKAAEAHRELQTMLWSCGSPAVRKQSAAQNITAVTGLVIPTIADMLTPFKLQEYATAGGSYATAVDMTEVNFLPNIAQAATLIYWCWKEEVISLVGASTARTVIVTYRKLITVPAASGDPIGILFGELYIGARTAAIAHGSVGNKDAYQIMSEVAKANFQRVVDAQRGQQSPFVKP